MDYKIKQKEFILEDRPNKIINFHSPQSCDPYYYARNKDILAEKPILDDKPYDKTKELVKELIKR